MTGPLHPITPERLQRRFTVTFLPHRVQVPITIVERGTHYLLVNFSGRISAEELLDPSTQIRLSRCRPYARRGSAGRHRFVPEQTQQQLRQQSLAEFVRERPLGPRFHEDGLKQPDHRRINRALKRSERPQGASQRRDLDPKLGVERPHRHALARRQPVKQARPDEKKMAGVKRNPLRSQKRLTGPAHAENKLIIVLVRVRRESPIRLVIITRDPKGFNISRQ
ncbi:MAG: hypothetical protein RL077_4361 [Verrucomicrobiota bacterium]